MSNSLELPDSLSMVKRIACWTGVNLVTGSCMESRLVDVSMAARESFCLPITLYVGTGL